MAGSAGLRNIRLVRGALRIFVAQYVMRSMAALAICRHQQPLLAQRKSVDGVDIQRIDVRQPVLLRHCVVAVARAAGTRNVERINRRLRIVLGKNGMGVSMATGAWMLRTRCMNASHQPSRFLRVAGIALHRRHNIRMRIFLDSGVAIAALQAAVDAGMKLRRIHTYTVPGCILQARVRMAGEAIRLRIQEAWRRGKQNPACGHHQRPCGNGLHLNSRQACPYRERER